MGRKSRKSRKKAGEGSVLAQTFLGTGLLHGEGVEQDVAEAERLLRAASEEDFPPALYILANACIDGLGVPRDGQEGARLLLQAAETRFAPAQLQAGMMHCVGKGLPKDPARGKALIRSAADAGNRRPGRYGSGSGGCDRE